MSAFGLDAIAKKASEVIKIEDGDYIGEDGLYYCGKCHTPKQHRDNYFRIGNVVMCLCKCAKEEREREDEARKKEELNDQIKKYRSIGFPEEERKNMETWTFENDDGSNPKLMQAMKRYADKFSNDSKWLLLFGDVGRGKTYAACCVANALIDKGIPCMVTNFSRIEKTVFGMREGKQAYFDSLNRFPLLVVDDLGAERKSEYMGQVVYDVIDARERAGLPMIITTNLTKEEMEDPADMQYKRIFSRVWGNCIPIRVEGKDRRKQKLISSYDEMMKELGL